MQIKTFIFIPICCAILNCVAIADTNCSEKARIAFQSYFEENQNKQIGTDKFRSLSEQQKKEAKIRNLCFGNSVHWYFLCEFANCKAFSKTEKVFGHSVSDICSWSKIDCFSENIEKIVSVMQDSNDYVYNMFFTDINEVNKSIQNGTQSASILDTDNTVCYRTDAKGDTVWHTFIKSGKDPSAWENLCFSLLKNTNLKDFTEAVYKTKNNNGKTAVQEADSEETAKNLLAVISSYYKQENFNCDELASNISKMNAISIDKAKRLINRCY